MLDESGKFHEKHKTGAFVKSVMQKSPPPGTTPELSPPLALRHHVLPHLTLKYALKDSQPTGRKPQLLN